MTARLVLGSRLGGWEGSSQNCLCWAKTHRGWKTRGTILKVLFAVLTEGGRCHEDSTPPLHKNALLFMAILFLKHFES